MRARACLQWHVPPSHPVSCTSASRCDDSCAASLAQIEGGVDAVNLIISPKLGVGFVDECWRLGIRYLFVQPGADAAPVLERAVKLAENEAQLTVKMRMEASQKSYDGQKQTA